MANTHFVFTAFTVATIGLLTVFWIRSRRQESQQQQTNNQFLINATRELLTPLTILSASIEQLRQLAPTHEQHYTLMEQNIQRSIRLLNQLLQSAGTSQHTRQLSVANGDVMRYIKEIASCILPLAEARQITLSISCDPPSMIGWIDTKRLDYIVFGTLYMIVKEAKGYDNIRLKACTSERYDHIIIDIQNTRDLPDSARKELSQITEQVYLHKGTIRQNNPLGIGNHLHIELPITKEAFAPSQVNKENPIRFSFSNDIMQNVNAKTSQPVQFTATGDTAVEEKQEIEERLKEVSQERITADQEFLQKAINCVHDHISDSDYNRETFASDMGTSVSTLYNKIRAITGNNISNFVRDIRIKEACRIAKENSDWRVSDIAYRVGFKDAKYFATSFKRVMGIQPKEYFNKMRNEE